MHRHHRNHFRQCSTLTNDSFDMTGAQAELEQEVHRIQRSHLRQCSTLTNDSFDMVGTQVELGQEMHRNRRSHIRQCSTLTNDSFDMGCSQGERAEEPLEFKSADRPVERPFDLADIMRMPPDPRLSDPWSLSAIRRLAAAMPEGGSALSHATMPATRDSRQPEQSTWPHHGADVAGGFPRQAIASNAPPRQAHQEKHMPPMSMPPYGPASHGTAVGYTSPAPMQASPAPTAPPAVWSQQAANNLKEAEAMALAAYARGVAAGVASSAFAKGFAVGAATVAAHAPIQSGRVDRHGKSENAKAPNAKEQPMVCKWYQRGTCKFGAECRYFHDGRIEQTVPEIATVSNSSECDEDREVAPTRQADAGNGRRISLEGALCQNVDSDEHLLAERQIFWCDQRAFKEASANLKEELEAETQMPVKTYRTAEMCIRLLRKKRHWQTKSVSRFFLVSWANAQSLVPFLSTQPSLAPRVVVLCDTCGSRGCGKAEAWRRDHPIVEAVATSWPQALSAIKAVVSSS
jgi:hypothetical protein